MSSHEQLSAASNDRKARLAQLKSLKRKQAPSDDTGDDTATTATATAATPTPISTLTTSQPSDKPSVTTTYLSGRNFDPTTRNVKLGFEQTPITDATKTLEHQAAELALASKTLQEAEEKQSGAAGGAAAAALDLFKLQPKRANWDLKRDLEEKVRSGGLEVGFENAVARAVRERVEGARREREGRRGVDGVAERGEEVGIEGGELVEAMHQREVEEERERAREMAEEVEG